MRTTLLAASVALIHLLPAAAHAANSPDLEAIKASAAAGDSNAQFQLAMAYDLGYMGTRDLEQVAAWCRKSADQGNADGQNCMGSLHQAGEGVAQDDAEAVRWYEKAAAQEHGEALTSLGLYYDAGHGVAQDRAKARELYLRATEQGSLKAMFNLGITYKHGTGVPVNAIEAYFWLDLVRFYTQRSGDQQLKWRTRGALDELKRTMSKTDVVIAERRAKAWDAAHRPH